ncbi:MAG: hypothetical protein Q8Q62_09015 [Mesorhizobium sp.]|nr:hypothetical protein [Mesorhizobium sp.]
MLAATLLLAVAAAPLALAKDDKKPAAPLPGVEGNYSIVTPAAEPPEAEEGDGKTIKAGNWELTISGYVWVQVGASSGR